MHNKRERKFLYFVNLLQISFETIYIYIYIYQSLLKLDKIN